MYLKDQITTCEVNIARVYNTNIKLTQDLQKPAEENK